MCFIVAALSPCRCLYNTTDALSVPLSSFILPTPTGISAICVQKSEVDRLGLIRVRVIVNFEVSCYNNRACAHEVQSSLFIHNPFKHKTTLSITILMAKTIRPTALAHMYI